MTQHSDPVAPAATEAARLEACPQCRSRKCRDIGGGTHMTLGFDFHKRINAVYLSHRHEDGQTHDCSILIDTDWNRADYPDRPRWVVTQQEPLTLAPSIQMPCGWHGHVLSGAWVA